MTDVRVSVLHLYWVLGKVIGVKLLSSDVVNHRGLIILLIGLLSVVSYGLLKFGWGFDKNFTNVHYSEGQSGVNCFEFWFTKLKVNVYS